MFSRVILCLGSVLAIGSAQLCGSYNVPSVLNSGLGSCGQSSVGVGLLGGAGVGVGSLGGAGLGFGSQGVENLNIAVGSSYAPNGIGLIANDLEIAGPVAVSGAYPILGAVSFGGNLPTGGQGQVSYSTAPSVGLASGGCGYGLPSAQPSVSSAAVNNYGLAGVSSLSGLSGLSGLTSLNGLNGMNGLSGLGGVNSLSGLSNIGCGCGL